MWKTDVMGRLNGHGLLVRFAFVLFGGLMLLAASCGGSDDGLLGGGKTKITGDKDEVAAKTAVQKFYGNLLGAISNAKPASVLLDSWDPECRKQVKVADLEKGMAEFRKLSPKITDKKIEGLDFANKMTYEKTKEGATVTIPGTTDTQIKVGGKWINAHDYFVEKGLEDADEGDNTDEVDLIVVGGKYYHADCDDLKEFAE